MRTELIGIDSDDLMGSPYAPQYAIPSIIVSRTVCRTCNKARQRDEIKAAAYIAGFADIWKTYTKCKRCKAYTKNVKKIKTYAKISKESKNFLSLGKYIYDNIKDINIPTGFLPGPFKGGGKVVRVSACTCAGAHD